MLQIISGKFFKSDDRHIFKGKGILYSNYSWIDPIETCIATLEPVDSYREVSSYVLFYNNQIEKDGSLIRTGDAEILDQFKLIATFGLRAYFSPFRDEVAQICRKNPIGATDKYVPSHFFNRFLQPGINGKQQEISDFIEIVKKVIGLKRETYNQILGTLKTFRDAFLASNYNPDLSYSMLIYCLEALAQGFDDFTNTWDDYDQSQRDQLDDIFKSINSRDASAIKEVLLRSHNLKLRRRFICFITNHINDSFFLEEAAEIINPLRRLQFERALYNAYILRSKFVHQLTPLMHQLRDPKLARGDVFIWENEPYLTLSGLVRIVIHVIDKFIRKSESVETEEVDWRKTLPGTIMIKLAPKFWIWQTENFKPEKAIRNFSGFLCQVYASLSNKEPITDLHSLMEVFEKIIPTSKEPSKITMLAFYWLYNAIIPEEARRIEWEKIFNAHPKEFSTCSMEMMIVRIILSDEIPWSFEECFITLKEFNKKRHLKYSLEIPLMFELALIASLANHALKMGKLDDRKWLLKTAIHEAGGYLEIQHLLLNNIESKETLDISFFLSFRKPDN
jgi:hypothetical protein